MNILISNDDGIFAPGLQELVAALAQNTNHTLFVVAPDRQRSAAGHSVTVDKPLRVEPVTIPGVKHAWSTSGTPGDCVKFAIIELLHEKIDLVISGINGGANIGLDVRYSGTVAAAIEGACFQIPAIAVSLHGVAESWREIKTVASPISHYNTAAKFVVQLLPSLPLQSNNSQLEPFLLNINVPNIPWENLSGVSVTDLSTRHYVDIFEKRMDPSGKAYYWLDGEALTDHKPEEKSDALAIANNRISITPLILTMTNQSMIDKFSNLNTISLAINTAHINQYV